MEYQAVAFTFVKQGIYYFARKVPNDLRDHYTSSRISFSLRTRKAVVARARATKASQQLDEHWHFLRMQNMDLPGKHMLRIGPQTPAAVPNGVFQPQAADEPALTLSEAVALRLRLKGNNRPATFHRAAERSCGYVIDACGDKDITASTRADANAFRDFLIARELSGNNRTMSYSG